MKRTLIAILICVLAVAVIVPTGALYSKTNTLKSINITASDTPVPPSDKLGLNSVALRADITRVFNAMSEYIKNYNFTIHGVIELGSNPPAEINLNRILMWTTSRKKFFDGLYISVKAENFFWNTKLSNMSEPREEYPQPGRYYGNFYDGKGPYEQLLKDVIIVVNKDAQGKLFLASVWMQLKTTDSSSGEYHSQMILADGTIIEDKSGIYFDKYGHPTEINFKNMTFDTFNDMYKARKKSPAYTGEWKEPERI